MLILRGMECCITSIVLRWEKAYCVIVQSGEISVAGLTQVKVDGIENIDLSYLVTSHFDYNTKTKDILQAIHFYCFVC